ncbi:hypothetical protein [Herbiconiux ginsengi]|uniref:Uncharacterized protein n=1 Tax=Herbiconiux ginsengi TaxID=381665 RepID=A0A1H3S9X1_9MICO|nr:hypothetical protein [Herbiconiux ginsengi]SDZ34792.1 hypothetical protein SAMN05216554_3439 [Herbiconiux ginsengi]
MTLTTLLPSLRRSIPDPLSTDRWPEHTVATTTDVLVAGISLLRLVDVCGTPCVHTAAAVVPGTHGRPSPTGQACVVVVCVLRIDRMPVDPTSTATPVLRLTVDGDLGHAHPVPSEARLVGRVSTSRRVLAECCSRDEPTLVVPVPEDLAVGDLIAVPCAGTVPLRALRER